MFGPQAFLESVIAQLSRDLKMAVPPLRAYARLHEGTELGRQADELAKLCRHTTIPARFRQFVEALNPTDPDSLTPADWAADFSKAAALLGPPKSAILTTQESPTHSQKGLRQILKKRARTFHKRVTAPRHPWPDELKQTLVSVSAATIIITRLRPKCKRWQRSLEELADFARFLGGDTTV